MGDDVRNAQHGNRQKPDERDRAEELANAAGAPLLHGKQAKQHHQRERNHVLLEMGRNHLQPLHRGQHRDGRGNDAVAIKQRGAENAHRQQHLAQPGLVFHRLRGQRQHGNEPALAIVVGAQYQHHVFEGDDDREGPEENGQDAVDIVWRERHVARAKHLLDRVQHAGADIAIDNTDGAQRERCER